MLLRKRWPVTWSHEQEVQVPVCSCARRKGPKRECPDYKSAGPHSCHFDGSHTTVWSVYCMNVTAITSAKNYTSQQHCLDVADIGEWSIAREM